MGSQRVRHHRATKTLTFQSSHTPWQPLLRALNSWQLPLLMKFFCFMFVQMHNRVFPTGGHTVTPGHVVGKAKTQHITALLPPRSPSLWTVPLQSWGEPDTRHPLHPLRHRACWFHLQISPICHISSTLLYLAKFTLSPCSGTCQTCSHDLWVTLQRRQCVPNVYVITLLCSCLKPHSFLHMLSGLSLSSFPLSTQSCRSGSSLPSWLAGSIHGSLCPWRPGRVRPLQPCPDRGPPALAGALSVPSVSAAPSSVQLAPVNLVELSSLFQGRLPWCY